jgi:hypothetical protein
VQGYNPLIDVQETGPNPDFPLTLDYGAMYSYIILAVSVFVIFAFYERKGRKRLVITDFRRGVHFVRGAFSGVLEPGAYTYDSRKEQITIVDMRPQPILIERLAFEDGIKRNGIISVAAQLSVSDPQLAATALREQIKDAFILTRDAISMALSQQFVADGENLIDMTRRLADAAGTGLNKVGMRISELEITEFRLTSRPAGQQTTRGSGVVQ